VFPNSVTLVLAFSGLIALGGCGRRPTAAPDAPQASNVADYVAPPNVTAVRTGPAGQVVSGTALRGVQVRLASPAGQAVFAKADAQGRWSLVLPPAQQARIFGLSETVGGRQAQGQGYLLVSPQGPAALLRAGAGALRLDPRPSPALGAVDFDNDGGAVISGVAPPASLVFLRLDGRQIAEARVDATGRYAIALAQPIARGAHSLQVSGDSFTNTGQVEVGPAQSLAAGPLRSQLSRGGLRVDWLTPGGGVQSTILLD
jgi:hypothetical protein